MARGGGRSRDRDVSMLVVDSNPDDATQLASSIDDADLSDAATVVSDGDDAMDFLHQRGTYADASRPNLVLLDLSVDEGRGDRLLEEIKDDPELRRIPVIVLTESDADADVVRSYERHANAYISKPSDPERFDALARAIRDFWLSVAKLPPLED